jgi:hypothetical protein
MFDVSSAGLIGESDDRDKRRSSDRHNKGIKLQRGATISFRGCKIIRIPTQMRLNATIALSVSNGCDRCASVATGESAE